MNTPVSFEIAKLLKEKGIHIETLKGYYTHGDTQLLLWVGSEHWNNQEDFLGYAPTISEVVMWLYEKHGIWVSISLNEFSEPKDLQWMYSIIFTEDCTYSHSPEAYSLPTEAYSQAIEYTLKNFI